MRPEQSDQATVGYVLIFTQTLTSIESSLKKICDCSAFVDTKMMKLWVCLYRTITKVWKSDIKPKCSHKKLCCALYIIQVKVLNNSQLRNVSTTVKELKLFSSGKVKTSFEEMRNKVSVYLHSKSDRRTLSKYLSYIFYALVLENKLDSLITFTCWFYFYLVESHNSSESKSKECENLPKHVLKSLQMLCANLGIIFVKHSGYCLTTSEDEAVLDTPKEYKYGEEVTHEYK